MAIDLLSNKRIILKLNPDFYLLLKVQRSKPKTAKRMI